MGKGYSIYHKEIHRDGNGGYWVTRESIGVYYVSRFLMAITKPIWYLIKNVYTFLWKVVSFPFVWIYKKITNKDN